MTEFTILRDTREQKGYGYYFEDYPVEVKRVTLTTGDYTVQEPGHYGNNNTYHPPFAVERKAKDDLVSSLIRPERSRFEDEIERAEHWEAPMPVIVEAPFDVFRNGRYYSDVHPNSIIGTVDKWPNYKNVDFFFADDEDDAEKRTFEFLRWWKNR